MNGSMPQKPKPPSPGGTSGTASLVDLSDLLPTELDALIERTRQYLPHADPGTREAHFLTEVENYRQRRDQPAGGGAPELDYGKQFYQAINAGPQHWGEFVTDEAHELAKRVVAAGAETGFLDHVLIAGDDLLRHLTGTGRRVTYSAYAKHPEHGAEILRGLKEAGVEAPYEVAHYATLARAHPDHLPDPAFETDGEHARALVYSIAFAPRGPEEATKLIDSLAKQGAIEKVKKMRPEAPAEVPGRWRKPSIYAGVPHESLQTRVVNTLSAGQQHVVTVQDAPLKGWRAHEVFHHPGVTSAKKGLPVFVLRNPLPVRPVVQLGLARPSRLPLALVEVERAGDTVRLPADPGPPIDFWMPANLLGRSVALKAVAVLGRSDQLSRAETQTLQSYLRVVGACLKAIAAVHAVPSLADTVVVIGPRHWTHGRQLALMPGDLGGMAARLALPTTDLLKACPSAAVRFGPALPAVVYDAYVAARAGWRRDTLDARETAQLFPVLAEALEDFGLKRQVAVVV